MLFEIRDTALNGSNQVLNQLDAVLTRAEDEVHMVEINGADILQQSKWYISCRPDRRKLLEEFATSSLYAPRQSNGVHSRRVVVDGPVSAAKAKQMANAPLQIILENDISDGALIRAAIHVFGSKTAKKLCFDSPSRIDPPALSFESGGGEGEVLKKVAQSIKRATERGRDLRTVVIADSDGEWLGDVKPHASRIRNGCEGLRVPCPPLNKRSAENYIPDVVWNVIFPNPINPQAFSPVVQALSRLTSTQRDYIKMDTSGAVWNEANPLVTALFADVSPEDKRLLAGQNFKGKGSGMKILALENNISLVTQALLYERDQNHDLLMIVQQIENEL